MTAGQDNVIIAYELNGEPLPSLRLVVPNKWGYKWIRDLSNITLFDYDFKGIWENAGYPDEADTTAQ